MGEQWSVGRSDLIPSDGPSEHPDPRMQLTLSDIDPCQITHRDWRVPPRLVLGMWSTASQEPGPPERRCNIVVVVRGESVSIKLGPVR